MAKIHTPTRQAAQGDILFVRVDSIPEDAAPIEIGDRLVLSTSETGHPHECGEFEDLAVFDTDSLTRYLQVGDDHIDIEHKRATDQHDTIRLTKGTWMVRRQREYTPQGWRMVED